MYAIRSYYAGVPIIAANMDTVGSFEMAEALGAVGLMTALHKFYKVTDYADFLLRRRDAAPKGLAPEESVFLSFGITAKDLEKLNAIAADLKNRADATPRFICLDVANGYSERFAQIVQKRNNFV